MYLISEIQRSNFHLADPTGSPALGRGMTFGAALREWSG